MSNINNEIIRFWESCWNNHRVKLKTLPKAVQLSSVEKQWKKIKEEYPDWQDNIYDILIALVKANTSSSKLTRWLVIPEIKSYLDNRYGSLDPNPTGSQLIVLLEHNLDDYPVCPICKKHIYGIKSGMFRTTCSIQCSAKEIVARDTYDHIITKREKTLFERYRSTNTMEIPSSTEKRNSTIFERYGVDHAIQKKNYQQSSYEIILIDEIQKYGIKVDPNNRSVLNGRELDIVFPDHKKAIEVCGLIWHSEGHGNNKGRSYHYDKWKGCVEKGYDLFTIFSDEYEARPDFWLTKILYELNVLQAKVIYARNCVVKEIDSTTKNKFLNLHHIQGKTSSRINLGLYHGDELVSVMTFSNTRSNTSGTIDLNRFCTKIDTRVVGGASKLLKYFIRNKSNGITTIVSFSDNRYSTGKLYESIGFTMEKIIPPDYSYTKNYRNRHHKALFRKNNLISKFGLDEDYVKSKTEWELMQELGYDRIWDCGKKRWVMYI